MNILYFGLIFVILSIIYMHLYNYFYYKSKLNYNEYYDPDINELNIIIKKKEPFGIYLPNLYTIEDILNYLYIPLTYKSNHITQLYSNNTPKLLYHINSYNFLYVTKGSTKLKLLSPTNKSDITSEFNNNKDNYTYVSDINIWDSCPANLNSLVIELKENNIYYIPPYWLYTIDNQDCTITTISKFSFLDIIMKNINIIMTKL